MKITKTKEIEFPDLLANLVSEKQIEKNVAENLLNTYAKDVDVNPDFLYDFLASQLRFYLDVDAAIDSSSDEDMKPYRDALIQFIAPVEKLVTTDLPMNEVSQEFMNEATKKLSEQSTVEDKMKTLAFSETQYSQLSTEELKEILNTRNVEIKIFEDELIDSIGEELTCDTFEKYHENRTSCPTGELMSDTELLLFEMKEARLAEEYFDYIIDYRYGMDDIRLAITNGITNLLTRLDEVATKEVFDMSNDNLIRLTQDGEKPLWVVNEIVKVREFVFTVNAVVKYNTKHEMFFTKFTVDIFSHPSPSPYPITDMDYVGKAYHWNRDNVDNFEFLKRYTKKREGRNYGLTFWDAGEVMTSMLTTLKINELAIKNEIEGIIKPASNFDDIDDILLNGIEEEMQDGVAEFCEPMSDEEISEYVHQESFINQRIEDYKLHLNKQLVGLNSSLNEAWYTLLHVAHENRALFIAEGRPVNYEDYIKFKHNACPKDEIIVGIKMVPYFDRAKPAIGQYRLDLIVEFPAANFRQERSEFHYSDDDLSKIALTVLKDKVVGLELGNALRHAITEHSSKTVFGIE